jgi:hypothetical protein
VETKFRMFGQAASKYMIVSICVSVMLWRHSTPRWKGYFIRISMVFFVLKGGEYALRYLRYKQLSCKILKISLVDKELKCLISLVGSLRIWKEHTKLFNKFFNLFWFSSIEFLI